MAGKNLLCFGRYFSKRLGIVLLKNIEDAFTRWKIGAVELLKAWPQIGRHIRDRYPTQAYPQNPVFRPASRTAKSSRDLLVVCRTADALHKFVNRDAEMGQDQPAHATSDLIFAHIATRQLGPRDVDHSRQHA
jgi:hypothetical protein